MSNKSLASLSKHTTKLRSFREFERRNLVFLLICLFNNTNLGKILAESCSNQETLGYNAHPKVVVMNQRGRPSAVVSATPSYLPT